MPTLPGTLAQVKPGRKCPFPRFGSFASPAKPSRDTPSTSEGDKRKCACGVGKFPLGKLRSSLFPSTSEKTALMAVFTKDSFAAREGPLGSFAPL